MSARHEAMADKVAQRPARIRRQVRRARLLAVALVASETPGETVTAGMRVRMSWTDGDPNVVTAVFNPDRGDAAVVWLLGRDLLVAGCDAPAGLGDVSVLPDPGRPWLVELVLSTDSGHACLRLSGTHLRAFLRRTYDVSGGDQR